MKWSLSVCLCVKLRLLLHHSHGHGRHGRYCEAPSRPPSSDQWIRPAKGTELDTPAPSSFSPNARRETIPVSGTEFPKVPFEFPPWCRSPLPCHDARLAPFFHWKVVHLVPGRVNLLRGQLRAGLGWVRVQENCEIEQSYWWRAENWTQGNYSRV